MVEVEVVAVAHPRHEAVDVAVAEEAGFEVVDGGDAAEVRFVQADEGEGCGGCDEADGYCLRGRVVRPVGAV